MSVSSLSSTISYPGNGNFIDQSAITFSTDLNPLQDNTNDPHISKERVIDVYKLTEDRNKVFKEFTNLFKKFIEVRDLYTALSKLYPADLSAEIEAERASLIASYEAEEDTVRQINMKSSDDREIHALVVLTPNQPSSTQMTPVSIEDLARVCRAQERVDFCESWNKKWEKVLYQHEQNVRQRLQERKEELARRQAQHENRAEESQGENDTSRPEPEEDRTPEQERKTFSIIGSSTQRLVKKIDQFKQIICGAFNSQVEKKAADNPVSPNIQRAKSWCHLSKENMLTRKCLFFLVVLLICCILAQRLFLILHPKPTQASP